MGADVSKVLLTVNGRPLLQHVMNEIRATWPSLVDRFILIANEDNEEQLQVFGPTIVQKKQRGLANAILQAELFIDDNFMVALGDCLFSGRFTALKTTAEQGCAVWKNQDEESIKRSYAVEVNANKSYINRISEKPTTVLPNYYCGMGLYFFSPMVFEYIRHTPVSPLRNEIEISDTLQLMVSRKEGLAPIWFEGDYLNVTYPEDIEKAEKIFE